VPAFPSKNLPACCPKHGYPPASRGLETFRDTHSNTRPLLRPTRSARTSLWRLDRHRLCQRRQPDIGDTVG
jgi:hypothetical protein